MKRELFNEIFDNSILPFIQEIKDNNSMVDLNDLTKVKSDTYKKYMELNSKYKEQIFERNQDNELLDRHKIASCICGAFLCVPVFNKDRLVRHIRQKKQAVDVYFYYVNEMVALFAATKFLSFFMINQALNNTEMIRSILEKFPVVPPIITNKRGFWNSVVFNLSQIKDASQIGLAHYDMYAYAMFFFCLENYFNENHKSSHLKSFSCAE